MNHIKQRNDVESGYIIRQHEESYVRNKHR